jgi:phage shock protein E
MDSYSWTAIAGIVIGALAIRRLLAGSRAPTDAVAISVRAGALIVDVRTPEEFGAGAHPRAVNIPLAELPSRLDEIPKGRPVVLYCASGMRSASAARVLRRAGHAEVLNAGTVRNLPPS